MKEYTINFKFGVTCWGKPYKMISIIENETESDRFWVWSYVHETGRKYYEVRAVREEDQHYDNGGIKSESDAIEYAKRCACRMLAIRDQQTQINVTFCKCGIEEEQAIFNCPDAAPTEQKTIEKKAVTNQDIIDYITAGHCDIEDDMWRFIMDNYREETLNVKYHTIHRKGNDRKYGRIKVCPELKIWRGLTFHEFYGGGIVD